MKQIKLSEVNKEDITTKALSELKTLGGVKEIVQEVSTRYYNNGETTHYNIILNDGTTIRKKTNPQGTALIDTLCELANVELFRVSEHGTQESKLIGWVIRPN